MNAKFICFLVVLAWFETAHADGINRCVGADGKVSYVDTPCDANATSVKEVKIQPAAIPVSAPDGAAVDWKQKNADFEARRADRALMEQMEYANSLSKKSSKPPAEKTEQQKLEEANRKAEERDAAKRKARNPQGLQ